MRVWLRVSPLNLTPGERSIVGWYHEASSTLTLLRFSLSHSHDTSGPEGAADMMADLHPPRRRRAAAAQKYE